MKKFITVLLTLMFLMTIITVFAENGDVVTVYNAHGIQKIINVTSLDAHLNDNWFLAPVAMIYKADDISSVVYKSDVSYHLQNGWYAFPVTKIYAPNGATSIVYTDDVAYHLENGWYKSPADFPKKAKSVALTYDDGPSKYTSQILDCLEKYGAKATFFVVGTGVNSFPDTVKRAHALGMQIGNHTKTHPRLTTLSQSEVASQLNSTANSVKSLIGQAPALVRPPYGSYNNSVLSTAQLPFILWSIDTLDWKTRNAQKTIDAVLSEVSDGDIILMHDLYLPTAQATEVIVPALIERGFDLVTVSELASRHNAELGVRAYSKFK